MTQHVEGIKIYVLVFCGLIVLTVATFANH